MLKIILLWCEEHTQGKRKWNPMVFVQSSFYSALGFFFSGKNNWRTFFVSFVYTVNQRIIIKLTALWKFAGVPIYSSTTRSTKGKLTAWKMPVVDFFLWPYLWYFSISVGGEEKPLIPADSSETVRNIFVLEEPSTGAIARRVPITLAWWGHTKVIPRDSGRYVCVALDCQLIANTDSYAWTVEQSESRLLAFSPEILAQTPGRSPQNKHQGGVCYYYGGP